MLYERLEMRSQSRLHGVSLLAVERFVVLKRLAQVRLVAVLKCYEGISVASYPVTLSSNVEQF
jgi:hypothetical protein